jgi:hypothetical protein
LSCASPFRTFLSLFRRQHFIGVHQFSGLYDLENNLRNYNLTPLTNRAYEKGKVTPLARHGLEPTSRRLYYPANPGLEKRIAERLEEYGRRERSVGASQNLTDNSSQAEHLLAETSLSVDLNPLPSRVTVTAFCKETPR